VFAEFFGPKALEIAANLFEGGAIDGIVRWLADAAAHEEARELAAGLR
jgi:hypothetical protein